MAIAQLFTIRRGVAVASVALVGLSACGARSAPSAAPAPASTSTVAPTAPPAADAVPTNAVTVDMHAFGPKAVTVKVGQVLTWTNKDSDSHTVTFETTDAKSGVLATGAQFSHTFTAPGTFAYHCSIHPDMHGVVVVTL